MTRTWDWRDIILLIAAILLAVARCAHADSLVTASAELDWTGLTWTTTGTLVVNTVVRDIAFPMLKAGTFPKAGTVTLASDADNGDLTASGQATTTTGTNAGSAGAMALDVFSFFGTGEGALLVTIPYHLAISSQESGPRDHTQLQARVRFFTPIPGQIAIRTLTLTDAGDVIEDGILTVATSPFKNTFLGPGVTFFADASVDVLARVPEASSFWLLGLACVGLMLVIANRAPK